MSINIKDVLYLPSGRVFLSETEDGYLIESTEMRDVSVNGKEHESVRNSLDPHVIWKHLVDYKDKWLLTVSTQKGCTHNCKFCDVAPLEFKGNLTHAEIVDQVSMLLKNTPYVTKSNKVKIGFARMGEPAHNLKNVLMSIQDLPTISWGMDYDFDWLPCFNTILPVKASGLYCNEILDEVISVKEIDYDGKLHLQISCNSTDESTRKELFGGAEVMSIKDIIKYVNDKDITSRTVTLNFIVMDGVEVDVQKLKDYGINGDKFTVKLIPLNKTNNANTNDLETYANYSNYEKLVKLGEDFNKIGVPTVVDAIAKCEEAGLCCGQLAQIFR